jgi:hypothetical protein
MMDRVMTELSYRWFKANGHQAEIEQERINCHHNFTQLGSHFGRHVWLTHPLDDRPDVPRHRLRGADAVWDGAPKNYGPNLGYEAGGRLVAAWLDR